MVFVRILVAVIAVFAALPAFAADDILDAMDQARKAYQAGDMANAKQQLDLASQLIGQKNAEGFVKLLPEPLPGWTAEKAQTQAIGAVMFGGASSASRSYSNAKGDHVDISITGDSAMLMQFATLLNNPALAGAMGKLVKVGGLRAHSEPGRRRHRRGRQQIRGQGAGLGRCRDQARLCQGRRRGGALEDVTDWIKPAWRPSSILGQEAQ